MRSAEVGAVGVVEVGAVRAGTVVGAVSGLAMVICWVVNCRNLWFSNSIKFSIRVFFLIICSSCVCDCNIWFSI